MQNTRYSKVMNLEMGIHLICAKNLTAHEENDLKIEIQKLIRNCSIIYLFLSSYNYVNIMNWVKSKNYEDFIKISRMETDDKLDQFNSNDKVFVLKGEKRQLKKLEKDAVDFNLGQYKYLKNPIIDFVVEALAGTGKSTTSNLRICYLLVKGVLKPEEVCCLTFTNASTDATRSGIYKLLEKWRDVTLSKRVRRVLDNYKKINVSTINSFFNKILALLGSQYGLGNEVKIVKNNWEINNIINKTVKYFLNENNDRFLINGLEIYRTELVEVVEEILNSNFYSVEEFLKLEIGTRDDTQECLAIKELLLNAGSRLVEYFHKRMEEESVVFLSESTYLLTDALRSNNFSQDYFPRYRYVAIDEGQDTNDKQIECLNKLQAIIQYCSVVVGDSNQGIYYWRNASRDALEMLGINSKKEKMNTNYRGKKKLVELINSFGLKNMKELYTNPMKYASTASEGYVKGYQLHFNKWLRENSLPEKFKETLEIELRKLNEALENGEIKKKEAAKIAILVRTNEQAEIMYRLLSDDPNFNSEEIDICGEGSLYKTESAKDLITLCRYLINPEDPQNMYDLILSTYCKFKDENDKPFKYKSEDLIYLKEKALKKILIPIDKIISSVYKDKKTKVEYLFEVSQKLMILDSSEDAMEYKYNYGKIMNNIFIAKGLNSLTEIEEYLINFLKIGNGEKSYREENGDIKITIQTSHISKGLEFYSVIYIADSMYITDFNKLTNVIRVGDTIGFKICLTKKIVEDDKKVEKEVELIIETQNYKYLLANEAINKLKEEVNIAYVAITRSMERLTVFYNNYQGNVGSFFDGLF